MGACLSLCEVSQKSMKGISRYLRTSKKGINYELKTGLFADDLLLFRCFRKGFIAHWRFPNDPYTLYDWVNASRLQRFRKTRKHMNRGKTRSWAIFVISKAAFTKTVIEPKFDDRLFLKNFSAAIDQCTIYSPIFVSTKSCLTKAQNWVNIEATWYIWIIFCFGISCCLESSITTNSHAAGDSLFTIV